MATTLAWWWLPRGRLTEARRRLEAVLAVTPPLCSPAGTGPASHAEPALARTAFALLTADRATAATPECGRSTTTGSHDLTAAGETVPDLVRRAHARWLCAYGLLSVGGATRADELNTCALDPSTAARDQWGTAAALGLRATLALVRGDLTGLGRDGLRSALIFREPGDRWGGPLTVSPLAALAEIKGAYEEAERRPYEGLSMARELGLEAEVSARHPSRAPDQGTDRGLVRSRDRTSPGTGPEGDQKGTGREARAGPEGDREPDRKGDRMPVSARTRTPRKTSSAVSYVTFP